MIKYLKLIINTKITIENKSYWVFSPVTDNWSDRWVDSTKKGADQGKFEWTAGKFYGDADLDKGSFFL